MSIRAIASEQLNGQIVESLAAGLLVVDPAGRVETSQSRRTPAARGARRRQRPRLPRAAEGAAELQALIARCLETHAPVARRHSGRSRRGDAPVGHGVAPGGGGQRQRGRDLPVLGPHAGDRARGAAAAEGSAGARASSPPASPTSSGNGLATIHGYSRLIRRDDLPPVYRSYVDGIRQETEALGHVVTNFPEVRAPRAGRVRHRGARA